MQPIQPTPISDLNAVLQELVTSSQAILGANLVGVYLQGSFAMGDWDEHSDVDFLIAIDHDVPCARAGGPAGDARQNLRFAVALGAAS